MIAVPAAVTTGNPPIQYAYELQATGEGQPSIPESEFEATEPPLTVRTPRGTYYIQLIWNPPIEAGGAAKAVGGDNATDIIREENYYNNQNLNREEKVILTQEDSTVCAVVVLAGLRFRNSIRLLRPLRK